MNSTRPVSLESPKSITVAKVHGDLSSEVVQITVDRLSLILHKRSKAIQGQKEWIAPFGVFISTSVSLVTAEFGDRLLPGAVWHAVFLLVALLSFCWFVKKVIDAIRGGTIEDVIEEIKERG